MGGWRREAEERGWFGQTQPPPFTRLGPHRQPEPEVNVEKYKCRNTVEKYTWAHQPEEVKVAIERK